MNRRIFFRGLLGLIGVLIAPLTVKAGNPKNTYKPKFKLGDKVKDSPNAIGAKDSRYDLLGQDVVGVIGGIHMSAYLDHIALRRGNLTGKPLFTVCYELYRSKTGGVELAICEKYLVLA